MADLIHECEHDVVAADGRRFRARVFGEPRGNLWAGWIEFTGPAGAISRTDVETTQPGRDALAYWASGLEAVYLEGALARAR